ncbi:MAG: nucleotidyltransferase family protein [Planctomycetes bacterium]|nr:nucleotidyltransferase family protein [Planctomycetota bacterium]
MKVASIILAAGASARFGELKQLVRIGKDTLVSLAVKKTISAGSYPIVVLGHKWRKIRKYIPAGCKVVVNKNYSKGQLTSLLIGLKHMRKNFKAFLIYPCDYPLVRITDIKRLIRSWRRGQKKHLIYALSYNGRMGHPILVSSKLKDEFLSLSMNQSARDVIYKDLTRIRSVKLSSGRIFMDIDSKSDYYKILKYV